MTAVWVVVAYIAGGGSVLLGVVLGLGIRRGDERDGIDPDDNPIRREPR